MGTSPQVCVQFPSSDQSHNLSLTLSSLVGMILQECRDRLMRRTGHPTIHDPTLALSLHARFTKLWREPTRAEVRL